MLCLLGDSEVDIRGEEAIRLHSMPVPRNGEPLEDQEPDEESDWGWDDGPVPDVQRLPKPQRATPAIDVKVVASDLLGTIFVSIVPLSCYLTSH